MTKVIVSTKIKTIEEYTNGTTSLTATRIKYNMELSNLIFKFTLN